MTQQEITWTLKSGKTATVTVSFDAVAPAISVIARVGDKIVGRGIPQAAPAKAKAMVPEAVAVIHQLILMPTEADKINQAIEDYKSTPEWQAKLARDAQREKELDQYYRDRAEIEKALNM